jgi:hypothetical protein
VWGRTVLGFEVEVRNLYFLPFQEMPFQLYPQPFYFFALVIFQIGDQVYAWLTWTTSTYLYFPHSWDNRHTPPLLVEMRSCELLPVLALNHDHPDCLPLE